MEGISIQVYTSIRAGRLPLFSIGAEVQDYTHTIAAFGGFESADFTLAADQEQIEDWLDGGLGRDIVVYDEAGGVIWEGFVDKVSVTIGGRQIERGPLMDVSNRVAVTYSRLDTSVDPPVVGSKTITPFATNASSIARYGTLSEMYSASSTTDANALTIRNTLLAERALPETTEQVSTEGGEPAISISCLGYFAFMKKYYYGSAATGTQNASAKIIAVLAADPNTIFSTDTRMISSNTLQVPATEQTRYALDVIKSEVAKGDASNNRWLFGIYKTRRAIYNVQPTTFTYQFRQADSRVELYGGGEVYPWNVLPARWMFYPDFMTGRSVSTLLRGDPRALFIESVTYTAPYSLSIVGGKVQRLAQLLARLGLGGTTQA